jgi:phosphatidylinositol alpha-1,6-mannosyltransferase
MERLGVPFGILLHGGDLLILQHQVHQSAVKRRTARALLTSASVLVANSQWTRDRCVNLLGELDVEPTPEQIRVVPLGADHELFRPGVDTVEVRQRYGLGEGRWLLSVARLTRHKGIDTALQALSRLGREHPDLHYAVVGSGEEREALEQEARDLGVAVQVGSHRGPRPHLPALYNTAESTSAFPADGQRVGDSHLAGRSVVACGICGGGASGDS